jgi:uncharacterized protein YjbJ (UPF0337 family)
MGEKSDKITGRAKQAVGAVTGDEETKREGERQEDKGKLDSTIDKVQDALEDLKDKAEDALEDVKDKAEDALEDVKDKVDRK